MLLWILLAALLVPASAAADAGEGAPACARDAALTEAAVELSLQGDVPSAELLQRVLRAVGSDLVAVRARVSPPGDAAVRAFVQERAKRSDAPLVCGTAQGATGQLILIASRGGALDPLDAESTHVRGRLAPGFEDAHLVVADGYGDLERLPVTSAQLRAGIPIAADLPRPARVQLIARGPAGPRPLAERMLPAFDGQDLSGVEQPTSSAGLPPGGRLQQLRRDAGVRELRENRLLKQVAQRHAARVCETGRVAHELEQGADPEQRLLRAGVKARRVGETVSRARSTGAAFSAFERSPSHRMTLLERGFTDAGIGEATAEGRTCMVVLLAAWPRFVGGSGGL